MTRQITIKMLSDDSAISKQAEVNVLDDLFAFFKDRNLYLSSFFRPDLIDWATQAISNDLSPDIWADRNYRSSIADERASQLRNAEIAINKLEDEIKTGYDNTEAAFIERDERIEGMKDIVERYQHDIDGYKSEVRELEVKLEFSREVVVKQNERISAHQQEILELKSKLWDTFAEGMP